MLSYSPILENQRKYAQDKERSQKFKVLKQRIATNVQLVSTRFVICKLLQLLHSAESGQQAEKKRGQ